MKIPWASIAKIEVGGRHSGTGFLIGPKILVTALHVVAEDNGRPKGDIVLHFNPNAEHNDQSPPTKHAASIRLTDSTLDFAVLECEGVPTKARPLIHRPHCQQRDEFSSPGFALQDPNGFTAIGTVGSINDPCPKAGPPVLGLQFDFGTGLLLKGHSGAPVLVDGQVVCFLKTAFADEQKRTMGGIVQATHIRHVLDRCRDLDSTLLSVNPKFVWPEPRQDAAPIVADRKPQFQDFEKMVTGKSEQRVLLLHGQSGTGKSMLVREFQRYARSLDVAVFAADLKGCAPMDEVFDSFLYCDANGVLQQAPQEKGPRRFSQILKDLAYVERPVLLSIDNWQDATSDLRRWVESGLLPSLSWLPHLVIMIAGHEVASIEAHCPKELTIHHPLSSINSTEDWFEFCCRKWPTKEIQKQHIQGILFSSNQELLPNQVYSCLEIFQSRWSARSGMGAASV